MQPSSFPYDFVERVVAGPYNVHSTMPPAAKKGCDPKQNSRLLDFLAVIKMPGTGVDAGDVNATASCAAQNFTVPRKGPCVGHGF